MTKEARLHNAEKGSLLWKKKKKEIRSFLNSIHKNKTQMD